MTTYVFVDGTKAMVKRQIALLFWMSAILGLYGCARGQNATIASSKAPGSAIATDVVTISVERQHNFVNPYSESALAIHFQLKENWHFYASEKTAIGGMNLKIKPSAEKFITFSEPIFPQPYLYFDKSSGKKLKEFSDNLSKP